MIRFELQISANWATTIAHWTYLFDYIRYNTKKYLLKKEYHDKVTYTVPFCLYLCVIWKNYNEKESVTFHIRLSK